MLLALYKSPSDVLGRLRTFLLVLQKMTAWVMVSVSYRSHRVSNFHSSLSTATKNCLMPSSVSSSLGNEGRPVHAPSSHY